MPDDERHDDDAADDDVFVLGRRPDGEGWTPQDEARHRATRRFALRALGAVVAIVAVSITLVALLVDTSSTAPASPSEAAQRWARALVHGDTAARRGLECRAGVAGAEDLMLILVAPSDAEAGSAIRTAPHRWRVKLTFFGPREHVQVRDAVQVVRRGGRYLVC